MIRGMIGAPFLGDTARCAATNEGDGQRNRAYRIAWSQPLSLNIDHLVDDGYLVA
jgi:hypothetical protein